MTFLLPPFAPVAVRAPIQPRYPGSNGPQRHPWGRFPDGTTAPATIPARLPVSGRHANISGSMLVPQLVFSVRRSGDGNR